MLGVRAAELEFVPVVLAFPDLCAEVTVVEVRTRTSHHVNVDLYEVARLHREVSSGFVHMFRTDGGCRHSTIGI